jgi:hypothetical protein
MPRPSRSSRFEPKSLISALFVTSVDNTHRFIPGLAERPETVLTYDGIKGICNSGHHKNQSICRECYMCVRLKTYESNREEILQALMKVLNTKHHIVCATLLQK